MPSEEDWEDHLTTQSNNLNRIVDKIKKNRNRIEKLEDKIGQINVHYATQIDTLKEKFSQCFPFPLGKIQRIESVLKDLIIVVHNYWEGNSPVGWDDEKYFYRLRDLKKRLEGQNKESPKQEPKKEIIGLDNLIKDIKKEFLADICSDMTRDEIARKWEKKYSSEEATEK